MFSNTYDRFRSLRGPAKAKELRNSQAGVVELVRFQGGVRSRRSIDRVFAAAGERSETVVGARPRGNSAKQRAPAQPFEKSRNGSGFLSLDFVFPC
jgi:hypothetical protein